MNIVILGAGGAGLSAAKTIVEKAPGARLTILHRECCPSYSPVVLPYYIEGTLGRDEMWLCTDRHLPPEVELLQGREAVAVDPARRRVVLDDGAELAYEKLLICVGGVPTKPDLPVLEGKNFLMLRTLKDADRILSGPFERVAIFGAGPVAVELAVALRRKGADVALISRSRIMRRLFDPDFSDTIRDIMVSEGVTVLMGQQIKEVRGTRSKGMVVVTDEDETACDMLVVATGVKPNLDFLRGSGIAIGESGGIIVDQNLRTTVDHIYAAGDCAETTDLVTGERGINAIWPEAVLQGRIAALNIIGTEAAYPGGISRNVINVFGTPVWSVGSLIGNKKTLVNPLARTRYTFRDGKVVGVQIIGEPPVGGVLGAILKGSSRPDWLRAHTFPSCGASVRRESAAGIAAGGRR